MARRHVVLGLATLTGGVALAAGAVIGVAAGVGAVWHATNPSSGQSATSATASAGAPSAPSGVRLVIENVKTPAGEQPAFVGPNGVGSPVLFKVPAGTSTAVTVVNNSDVPHTFTSTALGVNVTIPPGPATVHFTVDPKSAGTASWQCAFPCGAWVMSHAGYMEGSVEVTA